MFVQRWSVRLADEAWGAPSALAVSGDVLPCLPRSRRPEPQPARARATARRRPAPATMLVGLQLDSMAGRTPDSHAGRRSSCATAHAVCRSSSSRASVVRRKASSRSVKANNRAFWITEPRHSQEGDHGHGTEATGRDQGGLGAGGLRRWGRSLRRHRDQPDRHQPVKARYAAPELGRDERVHQRPPDHVAERSQSPADERNDREAPHPHRHPRPGSDRPDTPHPATAQSVHSPFGSQTRSEHRRIRYRTPGGSLSHP
jgi:hypothetical protein